MLERVVRDWADAVGHAGVCQEILCVCTIKQGGGHDKVRRGNEKREAQIKRTPPEGRVKAAKQKLVWDVFLIRVLIEPVSDVCPM
jgi:hypothetical protein